MTATGTTKLSTLSAAHSKQHEMEALASIVQHYMGSQTFLESLFSAGLLDWFVGQARDDHSTDIYGELVAARKEAQAQMQAARDVGLEMARHDAARDAMRQTFKDELVNVKLAHKAEVERMAAQTAADRQVIERQAAERDQIADAYGETSADLRDARADRMALEGEVIRLKARILDLMDAAAGNGH